MKEQTAKTSTTNSKSKTPFFEKTPSSPFFKNTPSIQAKGKNTGERSTGKTSPNKNTGLPDNLKSGVEQLSGQSLDDTKVHYNSSKPASIGAHAYAQGNEIHLAPGQEKHLPHEAWHVVQQKQGRVKPTAQLKGENINDDSSLEKEADVMGAKAAPTTQLKRERAPFSQKGIQVQNGGAITNSSRGIIQREGDVAANAKTTIHITSAANMGLDSVDARNLDTDADFQVGDIKRKAYTTGKAGILVHARTVLAKIQAGDTDIYVNCAAGKVRSSTVVAVALVLSGMKVETAIALVQAHDASLSDNHLQRIAAWTRFATG